MKTLTGKINSWAVRLRNRHAARRVDVGVSYRITCDNLR